MIRNKKYIKDGACVSVYPMEVMNITQGMNEGYSHRGRLTIDDGGKDTGIDNFYAPFDLTIKWKQTTGDKTGILACSKGKVLTPKGLQYVNIILWHDNDTSDLWVGKEIAQGVAFYQEGTAGRATGNHIHYGTSFGYYRGGYPMIQNSYGNWEIKNEVSPVDVFFVNDTQLKDDNGYKWQTIDLTCEENSVVEYSGVWDNDFTLLLQKHFGTYQDGIISGQLFVQPNIQGIRKGAGGSMLVRAIQKWCGATQDGYLGPLTITKMQIKMGTYVDGKVSPSSSLVKAMRKAIAEGTI